MANFEMERAVESRDTPEREKAANPETLDETPFAFRRL
jgi:hypothetical protein